MKGKFSSEVQQAVFEAQNGYCRVKGCYNTIFDFHHRLHNTKVNRKLYPNFLVSPMNCVGLCRQCHETGAKEIFNITDKEARVYENWLTTPHSLS